MNKEKLNSLGQTEKEFLESYNPNIYEHASNTIDDLLFTIIDGKLNILLVKRKDHPWIGQWALPGGFVEMKEDLDTSVKRELKEETHVSEMCYFRQLYTFGKVDRDPRTRVITTAYMSLIPYKNIKNVRGGDDAADAKWFAVNKKTLSQTEKKRVSRITLDNDELNIHIEYQVEDKVVKNYIAKNSKLVSKEALAADHIKAINLALDEIQLHIVDSGLLFNLLPNEFTLKQVQDVYETLTNKKVDTRNFRKKILEKLLPTNKTVYEYNRDAKLYKFNPMFVFIKEDL